MKASKAITISLVSVIAACAIPFGTVFAAENLQGYPVETTDESGKVVRPFDREPDIESVTDYAVWGNDYFAFATGSTIKIIARNKVSGDKTCTTYTHDYTIKKLDYELGSNGADGKLYFENSYEVSYLYGTPVVQQGHEFQEVDAFPVQTETGYYSYIGDGGVLQFNDKNNKQTTVGEGFSLIKKYGDYIYAIKDNTVPYVIDGSTATPLDLSYTDFSVADRISCGDTADKLKSKNYTITTAVIKNGEYFTEVNPDAIGNPDDTFIQIRTQKADGDKQCIVLYENEKLSVVATNDGMFITSPDSVDKRDHPAQKNDWPISADGKRLWAYAIADTKVYSAPFMSDSTCIETLKSGAENRVEVIERFDFADTKFYRIRYTVKNDNQEEIPVSGFVAANMLTQYDYKADDNVPEDNGDKEFSYDTNVVSVVLAIVIVALVIVAIMYIALIGTKKDKDKKVKKNRKKKKAIPERDIESEQIDDDSDE